MLAHCLAFPGEHVAISAGTFNAVTHGNVTHGNNQGLISGLDGELECGGDTSECEGLGGAGLAGWGTTHGVQSEDTLGRTFISLLLTPPRSPFINLPSPKLGQT